MGLLLHDSLYEETTGLVSWIQIRHPFSFDHYASSTRYIITCTVRPGLVSYSFYAIPISPLLIYDFWFTCNYSCGQRTCIIMKEEETYIHCVLLTAFLIKRSWTLLTRPIIMHQPDFKRFQVTHPIMSLAASQQLGVLGGGILGGS